MPPVRSKSGNQGTSSSASSDPYAPAATSSKKKKPGQYKCTCTVRGCRTDKRPYTKVSQRTLQYHKKEQAAFDRETARISALQETQALGSTSSSSRLPPQQDPRLHDVPAAGRSALEDRDDVLRPDSDDQGNPFNFGMDEDDVLGTDAFFPLSQYGALENDDEDHEPAPHPQAGNQEPENDTNEADDEVDSEFGADVEQTGRAGEERQVLAGFEDDEGQDDLDNRDGPLLHAEEEGTDTGRGAASERSQQPMTVEVVAYSGTTRTFLLLVLSLTAFYGLGRDAAGLLLAFFADTIHSLSRDDSPPPPRQLSTVRQQLGMTPSFVRFAVCPSCDHLTDTRSRHRLCPAADCGAELYARPGKPKITFLYQPLKQWLRWLLQSPEMEAALTEWKDREPSARIQDVYDGQAWQEETDKYGRRYTDHSLSLFAALGVDWFSPFRSQYTSWHSSGAIMMTILNLPLRLRNKKAMTYIAGCTPGPKEPSATRVGCYLSPLLDELNELTDGINIPTASTPDGRLLRLRLLFYCGDSVGRNKICGFPSHTQKKGCFCGFCTTTLSTRITAYDDLIPARDADQHRRDSQRLDQPFRSKTAKKAFEQSTGARSSPMNRLSYWRSVSRAPVDPMHCLELGLVKRHFHPILILGKTLTAQQLVVLQEALGSCHVAPTEQMPDRRLGDPGGGSGTAAHWSTLGRRLIVLLLYLAWKDEIDQDESLAYTPYSPPKEGRKLRSRGSAELDPEARNEGDEAAADDEEDGGPSRAATPAPAPSSAPGPATRSIRARESLRNIAQLSAAVTLSARRSISLAEINDLDILLRDYGRLHASLFGPKAITYNTHVALHIAQHVRRFGPARHFSAYHFESMNGHLGRTSTNRHRNGEIESTYTTAFASNARFELALANNQDTSLKLQARAPLISRPPVLFLNASSCLGPRGDVEVKIPDGQFVALPPTPYAQLLAHLQSVKPAAAPPLRASWSDAPDGIKVLGRMKAHASMSYGHVDFTGVGSRANASLARTYACIDDGQQGGELGLFRIEKILSHELILPGESMRTLFILGRRARRVVMPNFAAILEEPVLARNVKLFWTERDGWGDLELLPAFHIHSDAALVPGQGVVGVSAGEDARQGEYCSHGNWS